MDQDRAQVPWSLDGRLRQQGRLPAGIEDHLGNSLVQELHGKAAHNLAVVEKFKTTGIVKLTQVGRLHTHLLGKLQEPLEVPGRNGNGHALLGLRDKDLPGIQTGILQRREVKMQKGAAGVPGHLPYR